MNETDHDRWRDELAAYALGALEADEAAVLERHLADCVECRAELDWLRPAVQMLPESVERLTVPPGLRDRLMEQVRSEANEPRGSQSPTRSSSGRSGGLAWRPLAGLAALLLIAVAVGIYAIGGDSGGGGETTVVAGHAPAVTAELVRDGESGTLHLAHLHQLPRDEVLQAWVQRGQHVVSAKTLFVPNPDGTASATIDDMHDVNTVMVTAEPRGGSTQPTSAPIVSLAIPN
jgi:anti-sigma-K factor RskA